MLTLAAIFSDDMVLQRDKPIPVWGKGEAGRRVTVTLGGEMASAAAGRDGQWRVTLGPLSAGAPLTMTVSDGAETLERRNARLGEVWLAGGQSNMEMALRDCKGGKKEMAASAGKNVFFYNVPRCAVTGEALEQMEAESRWLPCTPETAGDMSAVAWFFACQIAETQNVPVGIIDCYWGGTSVSCWMSRKQLERTAAGERYLTDYAALVGGKTDEQYEAEMVEYDRQWQAWNDRVEARRAADPKVTWETLNRECGICPWPQPAGNASPFRPAGLYYTMLQPVCPYALRGFLYYQGEEDSTLHFRTYSEMMTLLIDQWRTDWEDDLLPFLFVQLPMYISREEYEAHQDDGHWSYLREEQRKVSRTVANTALAVLTDCGEFDNIHPLDKKTVGDRLALQARRKVYGEPVAADGPSPQSVRRLDSGLEIRFRDTEGSLQIKGDTLEGFELAGEDGIYYPARGTVGLNRVKVRSEQVPEPKTVRYAWFRFGPANLYNAAGLPAAPFRTDRQRVD